MTPHTALVDLLKQLFNSAEEIRNFVYTLDEGDRLAGRLINPSQGRDLYAADTANKAKKGRYVDAAFFQALVNERPRYFDNIANTAAAWQVSPPVQPVLATPPPATPARGSTYNITITGGQIAALGTGAITNTPSLAPTPPPTQEATSAILPTPESQQPFSAAVVDFLGCLRELGDGSWVVVAPTSAQARNIQEYTTTMLRIVGVQRLRFQKAHRGNWDILRRELLLLWDDLAYNLPNLTLWFDKNRYTDLEHQIEQVEDAWTEQPPLQNETFAEAAGDLLVALRRLADTDWNASAPRQYEADALSGSSSALLEVVAQEKRKSRGERRNALKVLEEQVRQILLDELADPDTWCNFEVRFRTDFYEPLEGAVEAVVDAW